MLIQEYPNEKLNQELRMSKTKTNKKNWNTESFGFRHSWFLVQFLRDILVLSLFLDTSAWYTHLKKLIILKPVTVFILKKWKCHGWAGTHVWDASRWLEVHHSCLWCQLSQQLLSPSKHRNTGLPVNDSHPKHLYQLFRGTFTFSSSPFSFKMQHHLHLRRSFLSETILGIFAQF